MRGQSARRPGIGLANIGAAYGPVNGDLHSPAGSDSASRSPLTGIRALACWSRSTFAPRPEQPGPTLTDQSNPGFRLDIKPGKAL